MCLQSRSLTLLAFLCSKLSSVEVWINGTAEIPFVFDSAWGGAVSCGCLFNGDTSTCDNKFPECPAFDDPGLNFGNAYYNDVHFHYGYFIHAAAVVSHFDSDWGRKMFERVLLLIRVIASPEGDDYFTAWRHKDWYQGHSWASGIAMSYPNGKNQESSSEAIAAYEAIALYGTSMVSAFEETRSRGNAETARRVERAGQLLTATELRSARQYYHVNKDERIKIFPSAYIPRTIGIMWQTMAQCQTWFGAAQYLAYGIQLLPLTPVAEHRDTIDWSKGMYHIFASSCSDDPGCAENGWSILQLAMLARVGHQKLAAELTLELPSEVFESAGGDGHSLTNTLWFFATREEVDKPLALTHSESKTNKTSDHEAHHDTKHDETDAVIKPKAIEVTDCGKPHRCTDYVLDTIAGLYSCRQRMDWLMQQMGRTEEEACSQIAVEENPYECGRCDPHADESDEAKVHPSSCPECTVEQCQSDLNRCPLYTSTFVCTSGDSSGGCSSSPWNVPSQQCHECCELTRCPLPNPAEMRAKNEASCPPCSKEICRSSLNQCPHHHGSQYLCIDGPSSGGCSLLPWTIGKAQCQQCCNLLPGCGA